MHERAGSKSVIHLHGSIIESRSCLKTHLIEKTGYQDISWGLKASDGLQLFPNVVLFGDTLPYEVHTLFPNLTEEADYVIVIGSSLAVQPASKIFDLIPKTSKAQRILIDRNPSVWWDNTSTKVIKGLASEEVPKFFTFLNEK